VLHYYTYNKRYFNLIQFTVSVLEKHKNALHNVCIDNKMTSPITDIDATCTNIRHVMIINIKNLSNIKNQSIRILLVLRSLQMTSYKVA